jgi:hypothetical protein
MRIGDILTGADRRQRLRVMLAKTGELPVIRCDHRAVS